jgi:DNA-directed RNA polymerase specialized sigma24 family protein
MSARYDSDQFLALHSRLLAGDRTASEEVASLLLAPLLQEISHQLPRVDEQIVYDGITEAILDYCAQPRQFDEKRGVPLDRFLRMAASRNVANALRGEMRRKAREEKAGQDYITSSVEFDPVVGNLLQKEETVHRQKQQAVLMNMLQDPRDQQILALREQGERKTAAFAQILGITHLPIEVQRREVKRVKDRIDKILRRHTGGRS